ncbi:MAG: bifunctional DNA-formamidopyrimidine glycosylase/DNA-(apurinic or apyrimidinic site) lyase [Candidatus Thiodiazotropha sp. (ex Dulcina madagascariensis)]|nr:bifunctional DNA-formamidopyrimidine glycosylase/DNA-(apurinic or apyrimidinic site) lyase [Candidatus Thiodiazotropha sp. (ex Dulcina madagascariensis)]MCU7928241.1 bifunctional DNA-formamidopyrimidine glycosylase/DNA-(apurinic or apyrimidinic site) lyase [Candidatus Thiodiazotropha sp. (ex Dulcina madagascariensis)]
MPELPEVETTRQGIAPHITGQRIRQVVIRQPRLRWPIPDDLPQLLKGRKLLSVGRRGKYLLLTFHHGTLILHLGMSGSLRIVEADARAQKHDHFELRLGDDRRLRLRDPRRFGAVLWTEQPISQHPLLAGLGPEPLSEAFDGAYLHGQGKHRRIPVKQLIMESKTVVGVGNIYANESLFRAAIHPTRPSNRISAVRYQTLADEIRKVLVEAISQGGTTLRDFLRQDGRPGYFAQKLLVYGKAEEPCPECGTAIRSKSLAQRSTFFCPRCQH